jgi:hypothetical protein
VPTIEGSRRLKEAKGEYDFAAAGGAQGVITLRASADDSLGNQIPAGSVIEGGYLEVDTVPTSGGAATISVGSEAAADIVAAAAISGAPWSTTGRKSIVPAFTGATTVKTTVSRALNITVATADLTAGKFRAVIFYR